MYAVCGWQKMTNLITYPKAESPHPDMFDLCYNIGGVANFTFPTMDFQFTRIDSTTTVYYPLSGSNLFISVDTENPYVRCLAMPGSDTVSIIGNIQQTNHYIEYDVSGHKLGFWPQAKCWDWDNNIIVGSLVIDWYFPLRLWNLSLHLWG